MEWYKGLNIDQKINVKVLCPLILGVKFEELSFMFSFREKIDMIYNRLRTEWFQI